MADFVEDDLSLWFISYCLGVGLGLLHNFLIFLLLMSTCFANYFSCRLFQMYKIMKEHKNPKVLSEGLLWMVSAVDDFGISHIKLKVLETPF